MLIRPCVAKCRIRYWLKVTKRGTLFSSQVAEPPKYVRKAILYWTRNPDLTNNVTNRIWAMVVDEEGIPHVYDSERNLKDALFTFDRRILAPSPALADGDEVRVEVKVKWGRHSFIEKGEASSTSEPLVVKT